jgi:hypothetical protein
MTIQEIALGVWNIINQYPYVIPMIIIITLLSKSSRLIDKIKK